MYVIMNIFRYISSKKKYLQAIPFYSIQMQTLSNILLSYCYWHYVYFVTPKIQYFIKLSLPCSTYISYHLKYNIGSINLLNYAKNANLNCLWRSYFNRISKTLFHLSDIFQHWAKKQ